MEKKKYSWWTETRFNQLVFDVIELQNHSLNSFNIIDNEYKKIDYNIQQFKKKYLLDEEFIWLFASNKITMEDLEYLVENGKIIKKDNRMIKGDNNEIR